MGNASQSADSIEKTLVGLDAMALFQKGRHFGDACRNFFRRTGLGHDLIHVGKADGRSRRISEPLTAAISAPQS